jgi:manganese/iron transport system permease protein
MRSIGGLLVYTLIINPAAAAYQLTYNLRLMFVLAAIFGIISTMIGLASSYYFNLPSGAAIVITSSLIFAISILISPKRKILKLQKSGKDYTRAK